MGPAAGVHGGQVVAEGTPADIMANPKQPDRPVPDRRAARSPIPSERRPISHQADAAASSAPRGNNLKNVTGEIPVGTFTCITGVSGGGKSTFTIETLYKAAARRLNNASDAPAPHERIEGLEYFDKVIDIDQTPDRAHAALEPGHLHRRLHRHPRLVRRPAGGQGARLRAGPVLVQRQGRPLRGLPGRRPDQDRDALPAGRLRHLRRLPGQALQPRDPGDPVPGQVDRRRARHDGRGGGRHVQGGAGRSATRWRR